MKNSISNCCMEKMRQERGMRKTFLGFIFALLVMASPLLVMSAHAEFVFVENGNARSVIVLEDEKSVSASIAARQLQDVFLASTGAKIPIVGPTEIAKQGKGIGLIIIGSGKLAKSLVPAIGDLAPEQFMIKTVKNNIVFAGKDTGKMNLEENRESSPATFWSVCYFLGKHLGVRWLWPGKTGTFIPEHHTIRVDDMNIIYQPSLLQRKLRMALVSATDNMEKKLVAPDDLKRLWEEVSLWKYRHMLGTRADYKLGHSFKHWWEKYGREHPEYFAKPISGFKQPFPSPDRVKLDVSNPEVADRIFLEWKAAGMPRNWNVCPNDGSGFCTCENCRKADIPPNQDERNVWRGKGVSLSGRYVALWNALLKRMKEVKPEVTLSSYAYSAYREAPPNSRLEKGMILGIVNTQDDYEQWRAWENLGASLVLRPNWWHAGGIAPYLPLHKSGDFFRFAVRHSMIGFDFDSVLGNWATQGANYYLIARLSTDPDLTVDNVIDEYCSAFGDAASHIRKYLEYWESFSDRVAYPCPVGGYLNEGQGGLYEKARAKRKLSSNHKANLWMTLPDLYSDEVVSRGYKILEEATSAVRSDKAIYRERIQFLRDGLDHLARTRDLVGRTHFRGRLSAGGKKDVGQEIRELRKLRAVHTKKHVVWGNVVNDLEEKYRILQ